MSNFERAFDLLIGNEGGYVNNPKDPGGETNWGVTKRIATRYGYQGDMKQLPKSTAMQIAEACYWTPYQCDQLPFAIAFQLFDGVYNGGPAVKWLQQAVGVAADGSIGPKTIAAVRGSDSWKVIALYNSYRLSYYVSLRNMEFINGWCNRVASNLQKGDLT